MLHFNLQGYTVQSTNDGDMHMVYGSHPDLASRSPSDAAHAKTQ